MPKEKSLPTPGAPPAQPPAVIVEWQPSTIFTGTEPLPNVSTEKSPTDSK